MRQLGINDLDLLEALFAPLERSPFYVKDHELRYWAANDAMARLCGVDSRRRLIGKRAADFYPAADALRYEALESAVLRTGQPTVTMIDFIAGADPAWLVFSNHPLFDQRGETVGVAGTSHSLDRRTLQDPVYRRVLAVTEILHQDPAAPLDVRGLAAEANISVAQLQRDFQKVFRMPLRRFLTHLRLGRARQLLLSDRSIGEVAHEVGFTDHSAFSRRFHQEVGTSPRSFRQMKRGARPGAPE